MRKGGGKGSGNEGGTDCLFWLELGYVVFISHCIRSGSRDTFCRYLFLNISIAGNSSRRGQVSHLIPPSPCGMKSETSVTPSSSWISCVTNPAHEVNKSE